MAQNIETYFDKAKALAKANTKALIIGFAIGAALGLILCAL